MYSTDTDNNNISPTNGREGTSSRNNVLLDVGIMADISSVIGSFANDALGVFVSVMIEDEDISKGCLVKEALGLNTVELDNRNLH